MQFLYSIAKAYVENEPEGMADFCFVFPNKRSITFFGHACAKVLDEVHAAALMPACITISDFVGSFVDSVEADRMELVFLLYNAYRNVVARRSSGQEAEKIDFNNFQYWAEVLISDFNDVDRYLVDARQIFRNVENLKEISANYLTEEQIAVIRRYWSDAAIPQPVQDFWKHIVHDNPSKKATKGTAEFVKLWQVMHEVYVEFRSMLGERGLAYGGMQYREALGKIKGMGAEEFAYRRYVFVGFNMLSTSEHEIFASMRDKWHDDLTALADFYWDNASPAFRMKGNDAGARINAYAKEFPSRYDCVEPIEVWPQIDVVGVPSRMAQTKLVGEIVDSIFPGEKPSELTMRRTAVVLPQESLCVPLLHGLPPRVSPVNITMGFTLRETPVASLLRAIVSMQLRARTVRQANTFFYEDVKNVLSNALMRNVDSKAAYRAVYEIDNRRLFNVPEDFFRREEFAVFGPVFKMKRNLQDSEEVLGYLTDLLRWLRDRVLPSVPLPTEDPDEDDAEPNKLDYVLVDAFLDAIDRLRYLSDKYLKPGQVVMGDKTVFHLVERLVGASKVNFEGMPLKGLQVMGVLEARSLDFENVILPSMNEKIFPRKHFAKSFIPNALRAAYGMSTSEHQEMIYSYYFYRMISRAKRVWLLYDARTTGVNSGDMSRYLYQLIYAYRPEGLRRITTSFAITGDESPGVSVEKTPEIMKKLRAFLDEENPRYLSASSINQYIDCPLQFYLTYIKGLYPENEKQRYIDEGTYGTIVHDAVQWLYEQRMPAGATEVLITAADIKGMMKETANIDRLIVRSINKNYRELGDDSDQPLAGDTLIIGQVVRRYVMKMLELEQKFAPFKFVGAEMTRKGRITLDDGSDDGPITINLTMRIDRLDRLVDADGNDSTLRVIDYKTGTDKNTFTGMDVLFAKPKSEDRRKAVLQLMLYCNAYSQIFGTDEPIMPMIYSFRSIMKNTLDPLKCNRVAVNDYHELNEQFVPRMAGVLREMFSPDVPFTSPEDDHACKYCKFTEICEKKRKKH